MKFTKLFAAAAIASSLMLATTAGAGASASIDMNQGLIAHYKFDNELSNSSGSSHNGTAYGSVSYTDSAQSKAVQFNGTNSYVQMDKFTEDFSNGITISVWASFDKASGSWARILDLGNGAGSDNILLARDGTGTNLCFEVYSPTTTKNTYTQKVEVKDGIKYGELNHILVRAKPDGANFKTEIYINGVKQKTVDGYGNASDSTNIPRSLTRNYTYIAKSNWGGDGLFKGTQDELRIYNRYLNDDEVRAVSDITAPVTKYHFDPINAVTPKGKAYIKGFHVSLQSTDAQAGVKTVLYRVNGGAWNTYAGPFDVYAANTRSVEYYSVDYAGNAEATINKMDFVLGTFNGAGSY